MSKVLEVACLSRLGRLRVIDPWEFCLRWFEIPPQRWEEYRESPPHGFREECVRKLAELLSRKQHTIQVWGSRFERMPERDRRFLSLYLSLRVIAGEIVKHEHLREHIRKIFDELNE